MQFEKWTVIIFVQCIQATPAMSTSSISILSRSVSVAEWLALSTSDQGVPGSNPAGCKILLEPKWCFIAQSLSCSPFHCLEMTEILLKGRKTLTHPSIHRYYHLCRSDFSFPAFKCSLYFFAFQLCLCWKLLTWSNRYLEVFFSFYYICYCLCRCKKLVLAWVPYCLLQLCSCITGGANICQTTMKTSWISDLPIFDWAINP